MDLFRKIREGMAWDKAEKKRKKGLPAYRVGSAESPHAGAKIPGAAADMKRLAAMLEESRLNRLTLPSEDG